MQNLQSTNRWTDNKEDKQPQGKQTNIERNTMLQSQLLNKICSLLKNTLQLPQYLTSWSNKSDLMGFISPALFKKKYLALTPFCLFIDLVYSFGDLLQLKSTFFF